MKVYSQLESAQIENLSADPTNLPDGRMWYNTTAQRLRMCKGGIVYDVKSDLGTLLANANKAVVRDASGLLTEALLLDANISPSANIAYGKLALTGAILNTDLAGSIAVSKLAALTASSAVVTNGSGILAASSASASDVATLAGLAGSTLVTTAATQTLSNKSLTSPTLNGAAADSIQFTDQISTPANASPLTHKLYVDSSSAKLTLLDSSGNKTTVGSGGAGGVNYISANPDGEAGTTGYSAYANTAGTSPVTGTGGSPTVTVTRSTASPLRGLASLLITKDAANRQGQGVSYAFTIDSADQAKVLQVSFDYILSSGTFTAGSPGVDSDITVWLYDVINGVVIQPTTYKLFSNSTTVANSFIGNFQTASNSTSYRLIWHCGSTSASAYTLKLDNVSVAPTQYAYGTIITDFQQWTPTFVGLGTVSTSNLIGRRVGSGFEFMGFWVNGTVTGTTASITLPNGLTPNSTLISQLQKVGEMIESAVSSNAKVILGNGGQNTLNFSVVNTTNSPTVAQTGSTAFTSAATVNVHGYFPVQGWSVQQQTSDLNDQRIVSAIYSCSAATSASATVPINFNTMVADTHSAVTVSSSAWRFTAPITGTYHVSNCFGSASSGTLYLRKNGVNYGIIGSVSNNTSLGSHDVVLSAGDYIDIIISSSISSTADPTQNRISIHRLANPAQISSTETIAASYWVSAAFTANSTVPINFDSKEYDTHGAVTTSATAWKFTAPAAGFYDVIAYLPNTATASYGFLRKNGVGYKSITYTNGSPSWGVTTLRLNAGDYIDICPGSSTTYVGNASLATANANIAIKRVGI